MIIDVVDLYIAAGYINQKLSEKLKKKWDYPCVTNTRDRIS